MAATVASLRRSLASYVRPDEDFLDYLNMVVPRLAGMGQWKELLRAWTLTTTTGYVTLPWGTKSVVVGMVGNAPVRLSPMWLDRIVHGAAPESAIPGFGLVDDGFHPAYVTLDGETSYDLAASPAAPHPDGGPADGGVVVRYTDPIGRIQAVRLPLGSGQEFLTDLAPTDKVRSILSVDFENANLLTKLEAVPEEGPRILLAEGRGDFSGNYRRFRVGGAVPGIPVPVQLLLRMDTPPARHESDLVPLSNLNAVKHGILACVAEDNADAQRAEYHWGVCERILSEERDAVEGMVQRYVRLDPTGGAGSPVPNLL